MVDKRIILVICMEVHVDAGVGLGIGGFEGKGLSGLWEGSGLGWGLGLL